MADIIDTAGRKRNKAGCGPKLRLAGRPLCTAPTVRIRRAEATPWSYTGADTETALRGLEKGVPVPLFEGSEPLDLGSESPI
jgi:hypothetical protein